MWWAEIGSFPSFHLDLPLEVIPQPFLFGVLWWLRRPATWKRMLFLQNWQTYLDSFFFSGIPIYYLFLSRALSEVCQSLEKLRRNFLWEGVEIGNLRIHNNSQMALVFPSWVLILLSGCRVGLKALVGTQRRIFLRNSLFSQIWTIVVVGGGGGLPIFQKIGGWRIDSIALSLVSFICIPFLIEWYLIF